jgi:hypothetical protein
MRLLVASALAVSLAFIGPAAAQQTKSSSADQNRPSASSAPNQQRRSLTQSKVRDDLQKAGFKDVEFLESAYVVKATNSEGNKVVMMISPGEIAAVSVHPGQTNGAGSTTGSSIAKPSPNGAK